MFPSLIGHIKKDWKDPESMERRSVKSDLVALYRSVTGIEKIDKEDMFEMDT